jgi:hypothetical protein
METIRIEGCWAIGSSAKRTELHYYRECASETDEECRGHLHASLLELMRQPSCRRRPSASVLQVVHFKQRYTTGLARVRYLQNTMVGESSSADNMACTTKVTCDEFACVGGCSLR